MLIIFRSNNEYSALYDDDLIEELGQQYPNNSLIVIGGRNTDPIAINAHLPDHWNSVLYTLMAQLLGVHLSNRLALNIDDPFAGQNTLSRVVNNVRLHDGQL